MTDYDNTTVHELVKKLVTIGFDVGRDNAILETTPIILIERALRKSVIREASVAVGTVRRGGTRPLPDDPPLMFVPWVLPEGEYDLIPKETSK